MTCEMKMHTKPSVGATIRKFIAGSMMLLFYFQMWGSGQPVFSEGAELFVMANSGLTLRSAPDLESESIVVVDYGSSVIVLNQPDSMITYEKIEWVEGNWIYVEYDGIHGYMFDGYLSDLPLPSYDFEKCHLDMDLIYPLQSWSEINLGDFNSDSLNAGALQKVTDSFEGGDKLIKTSKHDEYKIELFLTEVRLMDAYHLLLTMLDGKESIATFKSASTFIEDRDGEMYKILVDIDNPVRIRQLKDGSVKISIKSFNYICGM